MTAEALQLEQDIHVDGIEMLVDMAKSGKIDPWNIDIVDIADRYLMQTFEAKSQNLKVTGRTLLFASVLLKLKSNILKGLDVAEWLPEDAPELDIDDDMNSDDDFHSYNTTNVISIDEVLQRRTSVKLNRKRVVTLEDLIKQLEFYEMLDKKLALKNAHERAKRRVRSYANITPADLINLEHDNFIEDSVQNIKNKLEKLFNKKDKIELNELVSIGMSKVVAYLALLFLAADSDIDLVQEEFYSDLYVVKGNGTRTAES